MGIRRPGFQLLSLISPSRHTQEQSQEPIAHHLHTPCHLPDQLGIYLQIYLPLLIISILCVIAANIYRVKWLRSGPGSRSRAYSYDKKTRGRRVRSGTPERTEEALALALGERGARNGGDIRSRLDVEEGRGRGLLTGGQCVGGDSLPKLSDTVQRHRERGFSWTFVLGNRRRRISIPSFLYSWCGCPTPQLWRRSGLDGKDERDREREWEAQEREKGLLWGIMGDVARVAWPPIGVFTGIAWWMFHS